jgi:hypothetical protein
LGSDGLGSFDISGFSNSTILKGTESKMTYERKEAQLTKGKETQTRIESRLINGRVGSYAQRFARHPSPRGYKSTSTRHTIRSSRLSRLTHFYRNESPANNLGRFEIMETLRPELRLIAPLIEQDCQIKATASLPRQRAAPDSGAPRRSGRNGGPAAGIPR